MGIITWIIFGLIAGAIAKLIMPGKDPGGFIVTIIPASWGRSWVAGSAPHSASAASPASTSAASRSPYSAPSCC